MPSLSSWKTTVFEERISDRGSGSRQDLSVWRPFLFNDDYRTVYSATNSRKYNEEVFVVKEGEDSGGTALAPPVEFECVLTDWKTSGDWDGQLWSAICPVNYTSLSDVAIHKSNHGLKPGIKRSTETIDKRFRCVHESLYQRPELINLVWSDAGWGGHWNGATWNIKLSPGIRVSHGESDKPHHDQYRLNALLGNLYKNMKSVFLLGNPLSALRPNIYWLADFRLPQHRKTQWK